MAVDVSTYRETSGGVPVCTGLQMYLYQGYVKNFKTIHRAWFQEVHSKIISKPYTVHGFVRLGLILQTADGDTTARRGTVVPVLPVE